MPTTKPGFLDDAQGQPSSMRMMSTVALLVSVIFGALTLIHPIASVGTNGLYLTTLFLIGAFAPKTLQKFAESKVGGGK